MSLTPGMRVEVSSGFEVAVRVGGRTVVGCLVDVSGRGMALRSFELSGLGVGQSLEVFVDPGASAPLALTGHVRHLWREGLAQVVGLEVV